jgi:L-malate glycosyltransferase
MKVLWFVNAPFPALQHHLGLSSKGVGWWMSSLAKALCQVSCVRLGIATSWPKPPPLVELEAEGVVYYAFPSGREVVSNDSGSLLRAMLSIGSSFRATDQRTLSYCHQVIQRFLPDVIHVHGSEEAWGLIARDCRVPTVLSMQGILTGYLPVYWGTCPEFSRILLPREVKYWLEWLWRSAPREREIFRANRYFMGRTSWDQAWQQALQPKGRYWHVGELLRPEFHETNWELDHAERFVLFSTTSCTPLKGTDVLIRAMGLLRRHYPSVQLRICGDIPNHGWGAYLRRLVQNLGLERHVSFLGHLDAQQIVQQLSRTHVYVLPSHLENSPNSLCEAQLAGVPCVASCVGGVPSLLDHAQTGLLYPRGDHVALAAMVSRLFDDDQLARALSARARTMSQKRHDPESVVQDLLHVYREVIQLSSTKRESDV